MTTPRRLLAVLPLALLALACRPGDPEKPAAAVPHDSIPGPATDLTVTGDARAEPAPAGDFRLTVQAVAVRPVEGVDTAGTATTTEAPLLVVRMQVRAERRAAYPGLARVDGVRLTDAAGRSAGPAHVRGPGGLAVTPAGQRASRTDLGPGESLTDVLVFDRPAPGQLVLDVPLAALGGRGTLHFVIPPGQVH
jgi:hypothetical protein